MNHYIRAHTFYRKTLRHIYPRLLALTLYFIDIHNRSRCMDIDRSALTKKVRKCDPLETLTQSTSLDFAACFNNMWMNFADICVQTCKKNVCEIGVVCVQTCKKNACKSLQRFVCKLAKKMCVRFVWIGVQTCNKYVCEIGMDLFVKLLRFVCKLAKDL